MKKYKVIYHGRGYNNFGKITRTAEANNIQALKNKLKKMKKYNADYVVDKIKLKKR